MSATDEHFNQKFHELRKRAEAFLDGKPMPGGGWDPKSIRKLVQELRVAHAELEIQNEDLRLTQNALSQSRLRFKALFDRAPVGYIVLNHKGVVGLANQAFCDMVGRHEEDLINMPLQEFLVPGEWNSAQKDWPLTPQQGGQDFWETRLRNKLTGKVLDVRLQDSPGVPLPGGDDDRAHHLITISDITEAKSLERQLWEARKMESVGRLAGGIAHDFNNTLMIIQGTMDVIRTEDSYAEFPDDLMGEVDRAVVRAADLVQHLLEFAHKGLSSPRSVNLAETLPASQRMLQRMLPEDIKLTVEMDVGLYPVHADPVQIDQVFTNLIINARDAIQNSGHIEVICRNVNLGPEDVPTGFGLEPGDYVEIEVKDDGCGMDAETSLMVFEPFFTTKPFGDGHGLGLSSAFGILKQNKGSIRVQSIPGVGSTFTLHLPRSTARVEIAHTAPNVQKRLDGEESVLVVEDDAQILMLIKRLLSRKGYSITDFHQPSRAREYFADNADKIDIVVCDVVMPETNGPELVTQFRQIKPDLKFLFITGHADLSPATHALTESDVTVIPKPFDSVTLLTTLRRVLDGKG